MKKRIKKLLLDIKLSIEMLQEYIEEEDMQGPLDIEAHWIIQDGLSRRISIIGEATYQLQKLGVQLHTGGWAINFRNTLVHQ